MFRRTFTAAFALSIGMATVPAFAADENLAQMNETFGFFTEGSIKCDHFEWTFRPEVKAFYAIRERKLTDSAEENWKGILDGAHKFNKAAEKDKAEACKLVDDMTSQAIR